MRMLPFLLLLVACPSSSKHDDDDEEDEEDDSGDEAVMADILLVVDNSGSMTDEAQDLALAIEALTVGLGDLDWQVGITTASVDWSNGASPDIEPGEAGLLTGGVTSDAAELRDQILCEATCWSTVDLASDPDYSCGDAFAEVTIEALDCVCGVDAWTGHCGTGQEMGMEASFMARCRAQETPSEECYDFPDSAPVAFSTGDELSNAGLLRDGADLHVLVISDEGDDSPRKDGTGDTDVAPYEDALGGSVHVSVIGPLWIDGEVVCNGGGALPWAVERYVNLVDATGGVYEPLTIDEPECERASIADALAAFTESIAPDPTW